MPKQYKFLALGAHQARGARVFTFAARVADILATCEISRLGRDKNGELFGFQRPQVSKHIHEIRDYLEQPGAVLPNAIVVGFLGRVQARPVRDGLFELTVPVAHGKPGFVVDGQQRLTALSELKREDFEIFVSCVLCENEEELRRQFILINNTRPLPKSLIYELLPGVSALPKRLSSRAFAAELTERMNHEPTSTLRGLIYTHTNPSGIIKDTSIQKVIMNSADGGALRDHASARTRLTFAFELLNNFYGAVSDVFPDAWHGQTPRTSRLVHGAGVIAMGYVMESIYSRTRTIERASFARGIRPLVPHVAWTSGRWKFGDGSALKWSEVENTSRQIQRLALHLVSLVKRAPAGTQARRLS